MIVDHLFNNKINESLADEFMAIAKAKGMNPRLRGTPDEEKARTAAMLKQRAVDRANAPKPQPVDAETRAHLQDQLKSLEAKFDPNYEYSDDYSFWKEQSIIAQQIDRIKAALSRGVTEGEQLDELSWKDIQRGAKKIGKGAQKFTKNVADTGAAIGGAARDVGGAIKQVGKTAIADPVAATYNATKSGLNKAANVAANTYGDVKTGVQKVGAAGKAVGTDIGDAGTAVGKGLQSVGRGVANVVGGVGQGVGATVGGATTGLGRATARGFNTGVKNVGGNALDRLQTNVFKQKSDPVELKKQIDMKKAEIQDLEDQLAKAQPAPKVFSKRVPTTAINPVTGKRYTNAELAKQAAPAPTAPTPSFAAPTTGMPSNVTYSGFAKPAAKPATPNFARTGFTGYAPAAPTAPAAPKAPAAPATPKLSKDEYIKRIGATALPESVMTKTLDEVNRMLAHVETKDDVQKIKTFVDRQFTRNGLVSEAAFDQRNHIIEQITIIGAKRRREHARKG